MSLGVLNNLNAIYAESNLNNTNNSLSTVLNQLSSGSKINSGADDAAGLSLVDGLQANSVALAQSQTNASEGVGLLKVADGALSQVTSLLNRAVTLATEASNGTLNASQDTAANQEYQSILSEVNNIGATTTYNNQAVFNTKTNIYTGDSSATGSSIDDLNISSLSSSNLGDTGGVMAYSNGQNSVFINLSNGAQNAQSTDTLNQSNSTTINVNYLVKGADGAETSASTSISVGGTTSYQNTASGLVDAINQSGLGLSASFTTEAAAGVAGGGTQTGIQITGGTVSVGADPNAATTSGILNPSGITTQDFALGQTITVTAGGTTAASFVVSSSTNTLDTLANAITAGTGASLGAESVTASVITNGDGSQSIALSDATGGGALSVQVSGGQGPQSLSNPTAASPATATSLAFTSGTAGMASISMQPGSAGQAATGTLAFASGYTATSATVLSGSIVLSNGAGNQTFTMGGTVNGSIAVGNTLGSLAAAVGTVLGVSTTLTSSGFTMTSLTDAANTIGMASGSNSLTTTVAVNNGNVVDGANATIGSDGTTTLSMTNGNGYGYNSAAPTSFNLNDALAAGTSLVLTNGNADAPGVATTFVIGGSQVASHVVNVATETLNGLSTAITSGTGLTDTGINSFAVNSSGQIVLTSANVGTTITVGGSSNLADVQNLTVAQNTQTVANNQTAGGNVTIAQAGMTSATGNVLGGSVVINNGEGGAAQTFVMGSAAYSGNGTHAIQGTGPNTSTWTINGDTMDDLKQAINLDSADLGITATDNSGVGKGITLAMGGTAYGSSISVNSTTLTDNYATSLLNPVASGGSGTSGTLAMTANGGQSVAMAGAALNGTVVLANTVGGTTTVTDTFVMGSNGSSAGTNNTWDVSGNTEGALLSAINAAGTYGVSTGDLHVTATLDSNTGGIKIASLGVADTNLTMSTSATANVTEANTVGTQGQVQGYQTQGYAAGSVSTPSTVTFGGSGSIALGDTLSAGSLVINNGSNAITFQMAGAASTVSGGGHTTISTASMTLQSLVTAIDTSSLGISATIGGVGNTNLILTSATDGSQITATPGATLTDNFATQITDPTSGGTGQLESSILDLANGGNMSSITVGSGGTLSGTLVLTNDVVGGPGQVTDTFVMGGVANAGANGQAGHTWDLSAASSTLAGLEDAINGTGAFSVLGGAGNFGTAADSLDITASTDLSTGGIFLQASNTTDTGLTTTIASNMTFNADGVDTTAITAGHVAGPASVVVANTGTNQSTDPLSGSIVLFNSASGVQTTFTMGGATGSNSSPVGLGTQNITVTGNTLGDLATAITNSGLGLTALLNTNSPGLNVSAAPGTSSTITVSSGLTDNYVGTAAGTGGTAATNATNGSATVGTSVANLTNASVLGTGQSIVLTNNTVTDTFTMGSIAGASGSTYTTGGLTMQELAAAISSANNLNLSATVSNGVLNLSSTVADSTIAIGAGANNTLAATVSENAGETTTIGVAAGSSTPANPGYGSQATFTLAGGGSVSSLDGNNVVTGSIAIAANGVNGGNAVTFNMGATANQVLNGQTASEKYIGGNLLSSLESAIGTDLGVNVGTNGTSLTLTSQTSNTIAITGSGHLNDFGDAPSQSSATLGTFNSDSDMVSGTISLNAGTGAQSITFSNETVHQLVTAINDGDAGLTGVTANYSNSGGFGTLSLASNTYGSTGIISGYSGTTITDETPVATLSYAQNSAYSVGISNSTAQSTALYDTSSGQSNPTTNTPNSSFLSDSHGGSAGIATISYSDGAGVSLSASDLSNQTDAEAALTNLNQAITDVAAQDGYIGAQINTLNSVSSVLGTQQENVTAAQNAVQATDYAMATSNMSKYEILSQTGIAALAQANSMQQEVTKLLQ